MNSMLQTLFFTRQFRNTIYQINTIEDNNENIIKAMQKLFYYLETSASPATTRDLLTSFGWGAVERNIQHDVQEFNCVLCSVLESKVSGIYPRFFYGSMISYIKCVNVQYESSRHESFFDLQLDIKHCADIYESFDRYVQEEDLTGDNQYDAEEYGK